MDLIDRSTGKVVSVPEGQATAALRSGKFAIMPGAKLPVTSEMGVTGSIDPRDAALALSRGSHVAAEADYRKAEQERRFGGVGGTLAATGIGALRGAAESVGVPLDAALSEYASSPGQTTFEGRETVDPYLGHMRMAPDQALRERLSAYQELHPYASMGGELAGIAGTALATGGESALGAVGRVGESLAPRALGRVGAGLARGAAEGGFLGGISSVNEAALGDHELNAEKVVAGIGHGAFLGGALGAGFSGMGLLASEARDATGRYMARLRAPDVESLATKQFGYAPEGLGDKVSRFYSRASAAVSGKDPEAIGKFMDLSPEGAEARRIAVYDAPKIQEEAERAVRAHVDDMLRSGDLVSAEARGALKADYVAKAVARGNEAEVKTFAEKHIADLIAGADAELTHADGVAPQFVKPLETVSRAAYRASEAIASGDNAKVFVELDSLKRSVQKLTATGYRSSRNIADPIEQLQARRSVDWLRGAAEDLRGSLEDEGMFGKAAADQREINAAWTKQIDASQRFHRSLTTDVGRDPNNPYLQVRGADPAKVASYVRNLTNPNNDLTHQAVKDFASGSRELSDAISKSYDLPPEKVAEVARVRAASEGFEKTITKAEKALVTANQYEALTKGDHGSLGGIASALGFAAGGLPGGAVGTAVGAVSNPGRTIAQLAAVERLVTKVDSRIGSSVRQFFRGGEGSARALPAHEAATPKGFDAISKAVADAATNPQAAAARVADALGDLPEGAPMTSAAAAGVAMRVTAFLYAKLPPAMHDPAEMFPGANPPMVSDTERETWARYVKAAQDPTSVLEHLSRGDVTPEETEMLKVGFPRLYAEVQTKVQGQAIEAAAKGKELDYPKRVELGVLLETPTDPTMSGSFLATVNAARGKRKGGGAAQGPSSIRPMPNLAPRLMTTFEASSSRKRGGLQ